MAKAKGLTVSRIATLVEKKDVGQHQAEQGAGFGRLLAEELRKRGFRPVESYSKCDVADFECHLKKSGKSVEIISSCFMGVFTEVSWW